MSLTKPTTLPLIDSANTITSGLVFDSLFFEGFGTTSKDTVKGTISTFTNSPSWVTGLNSAPAVSFNGAASSGTDVAFTTDSSVNSNLVFSAEFYAYTRSSGGGTNGRWVYKGNAPYWMLFYNGGIGARNFFASTNSDYQYTGGNFTFNAWQHIVITWDTTLTANVPILYLNSVNTAWSVTSTGSGARNADDTNLHIGNNNTFDRTADANILYARIWNRILTANEALLLYENPWRIYYQRNIGNEYRAGSVGDGLSRSEGWT